MLRTFGDGPDQTASLWLPWPLTSTGVWPMENTTRRLESVEKEISGLIFSSDYFLDEKWPSFSTEAQSSGQRPLLLAAAMYKTL